MKADDFNFEFFLITVWGYGMLMSPNKNETDVHGCHFLISPWLQPLQLITGNLAVCICEADW